MNTYAKLKLHLERHVYTRGRNKGEAPAEKAKRGKSHFRVADRGGYMAVRMHRTDILHAYPDGRIIVDCNGWHKSSTTAQALNYALSTFYPFYAYIGSISFRSQRQSVIGVAGKTYVYYDGIEFDGEGKLLSSPEPFQQRRISKTATKELQEALKLSGFTDMYKMLYATCEREDTWIDAGVPFKQFFTDPQYADGWAHIIAQKKYSRRWVTNSNGWDWFEVTTPASCWSALMRELKQDMYEVQPTDVFVLEGTR